jgi:peroxiredoxin Q/BCP
MNTTVANTVASGISKTAKMVDAVADKFENVASSSILKTGSSAPLFNLPSDSGKTISLKDFANKTVVLYFYPKDDTPGCTQESCDLRDSFSRIQAKGAVVLGVSKDSVASHQKFKTKFSLPFPLLSDESGKTLQAYRVWNEKSMYGKKFMGIDRTTYLIDVDASGSGTIRKAYPKVKVTGHVDEILQDLASK